MKSELVASNAKRVRAVETGDMTVVGVNRWTDTEASPLSAGESAIETVDPRLEAGVVTRIKAWRAGARRRCGRGGPGRPEGRRP